jgi:hypothetical protein
MIRLNDKWCIRNLSITSMLLMFLSIQVYAADTDLTDGITVDSTIDAADAVSMDGACDDGAGNCTLRAAIMTANENAGADTISIPAGTYTLTLTGVDELCDPCTATGNVAEPWAPVITADASVGDLDITEDVTITGAGPDVTNVQWGAAPLADTDPNTGDRIFHVQTVATSISTVTIEGLTMRNGETGLVPTTASDVCPGGVYDANNLNAYDIQVVDNTCGSIQIWQFRRMGGAIAIGAGYTVTLYEETVHGPGGGAVGGGGGGSGPSDNAGPFPGGKPGEDDATSLGEVVLNDVVVVGSWAGADGGGVFGGAPSQINNSIIAGNTSGANGGGVYVAEPTSITDTTIGSIVDVTLQRGIAGLDVGNTAENGGGMFDTGSHTTNIIRSAINGNNAIGGGGIAGRAVVTIDIANSTVSTNVASDVGGGITTNGTVRLKSSTVANNTADTDAPGGGGGLNAFGPGTYELSNTIVAGNTKNVAAPVTSNCGCSGGSATCPVGVLISNGWNLEDADTCNMTVLDQTNTDPMLLALANNGGVSETHAFANNSPVIDAGDNNACAALSIQIGDTDQRGTGFPRSVDGDKDGTATCDIGAVEFDPGTTTPPVSSGGGGCSYHPNATFDPVLPLLVLIALLYLGWNSFRSGRRSKER